MYDARDEGRKWSLYVRDMAEFAEKVLSYTEGMDQEAFLLQTRAHSMLFCATSSS